jgi:DNA primase
MREDWQDVKEQETQMIREAIQSKEGKSLLRGKIKEFHTDWEESNTILNERIKRKIDHNFRQGEEDLIDWLIDQERRRKQKIEADIKRFEWYVKKKEYTSITPDMVAFAKAVPLSSFLPDWRSLGSQRSTRRCMFHEEKTPSFVWYKEQNTFYCFGCNIGGDSIKLFMKLFDRSFAQAVKELSSI